MGSDIILSPAFAALPMNVFYEEAETNTTKTTQTVNHGLPNGLPKINEVFVGVIFIVIAIGVFSILFGKEK